MVQGSKRKGRIFIYIAIILILGLVLVWALMRGQLASLSTQSEAQATVSPAEEMVDIVITTQPVGRGEIFSEAVLTTIKYPKAEVIEGTFYTSPVDVIGKAASIDIAARVPLTTSLVVETTEGSFSAFQIPQGMVAIPIPIDSLTSVSYAPQPGDHVNVIVSMLFVDLDADFQTILPNNVTGVLNSGAPPSEAPLITGDVITEQDGTVPYGRTTLDPALGLNLYQVPYGEQRPRLVSQTLLQDAVVLQVGLFTGTKTAGASEAQVTATPSADGGTSEATTATVTQVEYPNQLSLIVTPQDAVTLAYLVNNGAQLTLALRGAGDEQRVQTEAVTLQYLMDQYYIPVPAKLSYGTSPRTDTLNVPSAVTPTPEP